MTGDGARTQQMMRNRCLRDIEKVPKYYACCKIMYFKSDVMIRKLEIEPYHVV